MGGLFIPLVMAGALLGAVVGSAVGVDDPDLFIVVGVAAFLGVGYRVPLAAVMFVAETTGRPRSSFPACSPRSRPELVMGQASVTALQQPRVGLLRGDAAAR